MASFSLCGEFKLNKIICACNSNGARREVMNIIDELELLQDLLFKREVIINRILQKIKRLLKCEYYILHKINVHSLRLYNKKNRNVMSEGLYKSYKGRKLPKFLDSENYYRNSQNNIVIPIIATDSDSNENKSNPQQNSDEQECLHLRECSLEKQELEEKLAEDNMDYIVRKDRNNGVINYISRSFFHDCNEEFKNNYGGVIYSWNELNAQFTLLPALGQDN